MFLKTKLKLQEKLKEIKIKDECHDVENCLKLVKDIEGNCLTKSMALYILLSRLGYKPYVLIFKPRIHTYFSFHAVVALIQDNGVLILDPTIDSAHDYYAPVERYSSLEEFDEKIGVILTLFNEEEAYIRR